MPRLPTADATKASFILALVFVSGVLTGFLGSELIEWLEPERGTQFRIEMTLNDLSEELGLNPSQREQIRVILDDVIMEEADLLGELKWNQLEARQRIIRYLTPEQSGRFNEMLESDHGSE